MHSSVKVRKSFRSRLRRRAQFLALLLGSVSVAGNTFAQSYWSPGTNTAAGWGSTANWSPNSSGGTTTGVIPVASQAAVFSINPLAFVPGTAGILVTLDANRAASGITVASTANYPIFIQGNVTAATTRNLTIGAGGLTVEAGGGALGVNTRGGTAAGTTSGPIQTILTGTQTWSNLNAATGGAIDWNSRVYSQSSTVLTKTGPGTIVLREDNSGTTTVTINGETVAGLRGKIVVNQGLLAVGTGGSLGIRDAQTTALVPTNPASLVSDTQILSGGSLNTNNQTIGAEYIRFQGSGTGGAGAIVNNSTGTGNTNAIFTQVEMTGDATVGGATARFDFRSGTAGAGRFFQNGFTLTKTGGNTIGIVNTEILGGGNISVGQGTLTIDTSRVNGTGDLIVTNGTLSAVNAELVGGRNVNITGGTFTLQGSTNLEGPLGTTTSAGTGSINLNGGTLNFNALTGSITRPILRNTAGNIQHNANDAFSTINSTITSAGTQAMTFSVTDDGTATTPVGRLTSNGVLTGAMNIVKTNGGDLFLALDGSTYTGTAINISGGKFNLAPSTNPLAANITLAAASTATSVLRPGISGEGRTNGTLTFNAVGSVPFGTGTALNSQTLTFDGTTTGVDQHLRVGEVVNSGRVEVRLAGTTPAGTGLVVLEATGTSGTIGGASNFFFQGRGTLSAPANQLLLDYNGPGTITWRGTDGVGPTLWNQAGYAGTATNWSNGGTPDAYFDGDNVIFDDTVAGATTVVPQGPVTPNSIVFNNNSANYVVGGVSTGLIAAPNATLVKSGTGTVVINTQTGSGATTANAGHSIGQTTINGGVLEIGTVNLGAASVNAITPVLGFGGAGITINSGGTLRSNLVNVGNSGFGGNPVTINAGGVLDVVRGAVTANATNTNVTGTTFANVFSGAGNINLTGVSQAAPAGTAVVDSFGGYVLNGDSVGFSGNFNLNNARLASDNTAGADELGTATINVPVGSQAFLNGNTTYDGNVFRIAGTGWNFEPTASAGNGALRLGATGATIDSSSSIVLTGNARISAQNVTGVINAPISEFGGSRTLEIGTPGVTQNGTLTLGGAGSYTGGTSIINHAVLASHSSAFGTGTVDLGGTTTARVTYIAVGNGVNIANPITISSFSGQGGSRGVIEGGRLAQVTALGGAGVGIVSGPVIINTAGNQANTWAHFSAGEANDSALRISGPITVADAANTLVQARSQNSGGYVEFIGNAGSNYTRFEHALGTVRLGSNNGLAAGVEIQTRTNRVPDAGGASSVFDMRNFNQDVSFIGRSGTITTANFTLTNTGTGSSTLTIAGPTDSIIQNVAASGSGGVVNIVKNGTGGLVLGSGTSLGTTDASTVNLSNAGTYTVNAGTLAIQGTGGAATAVAGSIVTNNAAVFNANNHNYSGNVTLNGTSTMSATGAGFTGIVTANAGTGITGNIVLSGGATLTGNTAIAAAVNVTGNATIAGNLTLNGAVTLPAAGGTSFNPGNSPGTQTYNGAVAVSGTGNNFTWELLTPGAGDPSGTPPLAALGTPGTDYDQIVFNGGLDLTNLGTAGFTINVVGLANPTTPGVVAGFDQTDGYTWLLFDNASLTGFDPADFVINTGGFSGSNPFTGTFSVATIGTDVVLQYTANAIPEPGSIMLIVGAGLGLIMRRRRQSKNDGSENLG